MKAKPYAAYFCLPLPRFCSVWLLFRRKERTVYMDCTFFFSAYISALIDLFHYFHHFAYILFSEIYLRIIYYKARNTHNIVFVF